LQIQVLSVVQLPVDFHSRSGFENQASICCSNGAIQQLPQLHLRKSQPRIFVADRAPGSKADVVAESI
jgi:hypothetical protein